ncbi:MAG: hypothetical protein WAT93_02205, partial [Pontixanthobacter sp.]
VPTMYVPPRDTYGARQTVNYGLSTSQTVWNFRSALNVAALNCQGPQYEPLIPVYRSLLDNNKRELTRINDRIVAEFRTNYGSTYRNAFDGYMTQVYNYFALPPAQTQFCDMALEVSNAYASSSGVSLESFALANLPRLENVFDQFYTALEQYRIDVATWDAQYAPPPPTPTNSFAPIDQTTMSAPALVQPFMPASEPMAATPQIYTVEVAPSDAAAPVGRETIGGDVVADVSVTPGFSDPVTPVFVSNPVVEPVPSGE